MSLVGVIDLVAVVAFGAAFALAIRWAALDARPGMRLINGFFVAAMGIYAFVSVSNSLEHLGVTSALDVYEDYLEMLFIPLMLYVTASWALLQDRNRLDSAYRMLANEHELLDSIIEASPTCLVVAESDGRITFANEHAKTVLGLGDDEGRSEVPAPAWTLRSLDAGGQAADAGRFILAHVSDEPVVGQTCALEWPDGRRVMLSVNASPMSSEAGATTTVYAFEDVGYRKAL